MFNIREFHIQIQVSGFSWKIRRAGTIWSLSLMAGCWRGGQLWPLWLQSLSYIQGCHQFTSLGGRQMSLPTTQAIYLVLTSMWPRPGQLGMSPQVLIFIFFYYYYYFNFWLYHATCRILVPRPGIGPAPPAAEAPSLNRWTPRKVPPQVFNVALALGRL